MPFTVYVIRSIPFGIHYTGQTEDLERRLIEHNKGLLGRFTKGKGPWEVVYTRLFDTRIEAVKHEKYLKTGVGRDYLKSMGVK
jgi:putative endonuclease